MVAGGLAACAIVALVHLGAEPTPAPLRAQITNLADGFKLRPGEQRAVEVRVAGGGPALRWTLSLRAAGGGEATAIASGAGVVAGTAVAVLSGDDLAAGTAYSLELVATDGYASNAATVEFLATDPAYALIPLDEGNRWRQVSGSIYGTSASGERILYAGPAADPMQLLLLDRPSGTRELLRVPVWATEGARLTSDGSAFCFYGLFSSSGLGCLDLATQISTLFDRQGDNLYSTDASGQRAVYWGAASTDLQYFLYDRTVGMRRQLTDDPAAVKTHVDLAYCPQVLGTRPLISADGSTVVIITHATLGLVAPDENVGCHVFTYDVERDEWRHVAGLPRAIVLGSATLTADGRWLSFAAFARPPRNSAGILLDLQTGELQDPVLDNEPWPTFDAVITGDSSGIVFSTMADIDPRVGNADHNMELFYLDRSTGDVRQITETTGGIVSSSGDCEPYRPAVSGDGGVVVLGGFYILSIPPCRLGGVQRNERDGFVYRFTRAVRRRPGNQGPVFDPVRDRQVLAGDTVTLRLAARDPDGDPISFFAQVKGGQDVPPGSVMTDHHDGTATFRWPTRPEHAGTTVLRVAAYDEGGGQVIQDVVIAIAASERSPTPTATPLLSTTPLPTSTPLPTAAPPVCAGDCDGDGQVTITELITATGIALGSTHPDACRPAACGAPPVVTVTCLVRAVATALTGCPA